MKNFMYAKRGFVLCALVILLAPFVVGLSFGNSWLRILDFVLLYGMLALGLNIVVGYAGLLDLGYIAFYAVGAYVFAILASPHFGFHLSPWLILPIGAIVAGIAGAVLGAPTLRLRGDYLAIVTLGFGEIVRLFMNNLDRPINITNGPQGINNIDGMHIASWQFNEGFQIAGYSFTSEYAYYYLFAFLLLMIIGISIRLENSRIGRAWVAIREDEVAAVAMGINTRNLKLLAFAMGASFGGLAGGLFASFQSYISPESFTLMESIMILCMVVLGGMGNIWGVLLGAFLLTVSPEFLRSVIVPLQREMLGRIIIDPENLRMLLFGLALIAMMLFRPAGLWPTRQRQHELESRHD